MKNKEVLDLLIKRAFNCRRIGGGPSIEEEIGNTLTLLVSFIDYFNRLDEDADVVEFNDVRVSLENVKVLKELSFLVIPSSIRTNPLDRKTKDLRYVPAYGIELQTYNYNEYIDAMHRFRAYFKKDFNENLESLENLRRNISLFDTFSKVAVESLTSDGVNTFIVHYMDDNVWPYFVRFEVSSLFHNNYFNSDFSYVANDFISRITF